MRPLIVIVGETGSGKSELAIRLAKKFNGEVIAADSRTVYKGMDIGTAKVAPAERDGIRHHLLDVVEPDQDFSAAEFKKMAVQAIDQIANGGKLPILAGGSGLYIDSVLYDYKFRTPPSSAREYLNKKTVTELQLMIQERGLPVPVNSRNPRHLIRTIETDGLVSVKDELRRNTLIIGLQPDRDELKTRLETRADAMIRAGLVAEVKRLSETYGWEIKPMQAPAYKAFRNYIEGHESLAEAKQKFVRYDLDLAKRQRTWFKRNKSIQWFSTPVNWSTVVAVVTTFLNK